MVSYILIGLDKFKFRTKYVLRDFVMNNLDKEMKKMNDYKE